MNITTDTTPCGQAHTNLGIAQGEPVALGMAIAGDDAPVDLTDATLAFTVGLPTPLALTTANGGITVTDAANGRCQVNISAATTRALPLGSYPYDAWLNGSLQLLAGRFTVRAPVTPL